MKYTIYINDNTPGRERRPTFRDDLDADLYEEIIEADNDEEAYKNAFLYVADYADEEDFIDDWGYDEEDEIDYKDLIEDADWGDGSPFIYKIEDENGNELFVGCEKEDFYDECEDYDDEEDYEDLDEEWFEHKKYFTNDAYGNFIDLATFKVLGKATQELSDKLIADGWTWTW